MQKKLNYTGIYKILLYTLLFAAFITGCKKSNDRVFDESPNIRLQKALDAYQAQLTTAPNGWKALVEPAGGGKYTFFFKFNTSNRVFMYSDFSLESAGTLAESSYRLKALQQPSLLFDTYSYLHLLADPDPAVNNGTVGEGLRSDFEFYFAPSSSADTINLVGRFNGSKATLVKASQQEEVAYNNQGLAKQVAFNKYIDDIQQYWKNTIIDGVNYSVFVNTTNRTVTFYYKDANGNIQRFTTNYYFTLSGIFLIEPFVNGSTTITSFGNPVWDAAAMSISLTCNDASVTVAGSVSPVIIDVNAPLNWWQDAIQADSYWYSGSGFHINGVDDAYNINSLTEAPDLPYFYYLVYYPGYQSTYDLFTPFFLNADFTAIDFMYGSAPRRPTFSNTPIPGLVKFTELGRFNPPPPASFPTSGPAADTFDQFYNTGGYYFVKTSETTYDMVSAADSKIWITWTLN